MFVAFQGFQCCAGPGAGPNVASVKCATEPLERNRTAWNEDTGKQDINLFGTYSERRKLCLRMHLYKCVRYVLVNMYTYLCAYAYRSPSCVVYWFTDVCHCVGAVLEQATLFFSSESSAYCYSVIHSLYDILSSFYIGQRRPLFFCNLFPIARSRVMVTLMSAHVWLLVIFSCLLAQKKARTKRPGVM